MRACEGDGLIGSSSCRRPGVSNGAFSSTVVQKTVATAQLWAVSQHSRQNAQLGGTQQLTGASDQLDYRCSCSPRHTAPVISRDLAVRLAPHVSWTPANGDMFFIPRPEIAESVFIVSDMVVELVTSGGESRFHFNGTVEWALDSVDSDGVVWLPREDQLRQLLGDYFLSLDSSAGGFVVTVSGPGKAYHTQAEREAADAYAHAALYVLGAERPSLVK
jgi:hypothetical protein